MRQAVVLSLFVALVAGALVGCDSASVQQAEMPSFEEVGLKHNAVVAEVFAQVRGSQGKTALLTDPAQVSRLVWQTSTVRALSSEGQSQETYNQNLDELRSYVREKTGLAKNDSVTLSIAELNEAGILSAAQVGFFEEINAVDLAMYDSVAATAAIQAIEERAYAQLGDEANIVLIYSATLRHSISYWNHEGEEWMTELGSSSSKAMKVDWESVAKADAGGAVVGAIGGAWAGLKAGAAASLMFGPGGGVMVFSGNFLTGIVVGAGGASIGRAVEEAI